MANTITIGDFNSQKENFTVIDVREPDEMAGGKIDGSKNVPLGLVIRNAKKGQMDELKGKKICVYCASGYRGNIATDELTKAGFDAVNLDGGYGTCPGCREITKLTVHHDKNLKIKVMICDSCHKVIESYIQYCDKIKS